VDFVMGAVLGSPSDSTAIAVVAVTPNDQIDVRHLERFRRLPYTDLTGSTMQALDHLTNRGRLDTERWADAELRESVQRCP
jgi:hypothetical protein